MKRYFIILLFSFIFPSFVSAALIFMQNHTSIKGDIIHYYLDQVIIEEQGKQKSIPFKEIILILINPQYNFKVKKFLPGIANPIYKKQNEKEIILLLESGTAVFTRRVVGKRISNYYSNKAIRAILFDLKYYLILKKIGARGIIRRDGYQSRKKYSKYVRTLQFGSFISMPVTFAYGSSHKDGEREYDLKNPHPGFSVLKYGHIFHFNPFGIGIGYNIFQYRRFFDTSIKSWLNPDIWVPLYVYPDYWRRRDVYLFFEFGWLPHPDYPRYIDMKLSYIMTTFEIQFPLEFSLGALYYEGNNWNLYFSFTIHIGIFMGKYH